MSTIRNPIADIINKAKNFYLLSNFTEEKKCYEKIYNVYEDNINILNKLLTFQISIERWEFALTSALLIRKLINNIDIVNNLALLNIKLKKLDKAEDLYKESLSIEENYKAYEGIGYIHYLNEDFIESKKNYSKAKKINPSSYTSYNQLGVIERALGDYKKAKRNFEKAIEIDNSNSTSYANLINLEISYNTPLERILSLIEKNKELSIEEEIKKINENKMIQTYKLTHHYEQVIYLESLKGINKAEEDFKTLYENKILAENIKSNYINLNEEEIIIISECMRNAHIYKSKKNTNNYLNIKHDWKKLENEYLNSNPSILIIDNFLDSIAIDEIRNYLLESNIWNEKYHHSNYLGAFCGKGNFSKIHHGIISEMKKLLPNMLKGHKFEQLWSFNYNNKERTGIEIHADFAQVNVNFWLTPDIFNKEPGQGGLKIYTIPAPDEWKFIDYNTRNIEMDKIIKTYKDKFINVPYKYNRAVIFDSSLFHETQSLLFEDCYEGRRINSTILFGNRY